MPEELHPVNALWQKGGERFRVLVESVRDYGIITLDPRGYITSWNEGARRIHGYEADEILGSHFSRFYPPEEIAAGKPERELEQAKAEGRVEDEGWRLRKDGTRFWADVVITALYDAITGELRGFGKVTRDLTERKRAEERLRQSEEQFRLLVESVSEYAIFMLDPTGRVATWNPGAERIKGYTVSEIVGEHFERFYTEADRARGRPRALLELARRNGSVRELGVRVRKDGTTFHAEVVITAMLDATGELRGFSKVTRDITDQIRSREAEAARLVAERANQAKDDFLAVLSHELRTPLTPVIAGTSYLLDHASTLSPVEIVEEVGAIRRNTLLEAQLIDDLLDLTRISRGKIELHCEALDLHAALRDTVGMLKEEFAAKELRVTSCLDAREHWVWGDPTRLRQVFWNLLINAVKFTGERGSITVRTCNPAEERLVIEVIDSGVGLTPEQTERIFIAFEQGERTVTRKFGGLGLGLAITRSLVQMHHGTIEARSAGKGKGSTFGVELGTVPHIVPEKGEPASAPKEEKRLRILLVDDHDDTRRILARLLAKEGHDVKTADCSATARAFLSAELFDVLVSDIGLPDESGHELLSWARGEQPQLRGIALSGFGMEEDVLRSAQAGFDFHFTKPVDLRVLKQALADIGAG